LYTCITGDKDVVKYTVAWIVERCYGGWFQRWQVCT